MVLTNITKYIFSIFLPKHILADPSLDGWLTRTHTHTHMHTYTQRYTHVHTHLHILTWVHIQLQTHRHSYLLAHPHIVTHTHNTLTFMHTNIEHLLLSFKLSLYLPHIHTLTHPHPTVLLSQLTEVDINELEREKMRESWSAYVCARVCGDGHALWAEVLYKTSVCMERGSKKLSFTRPAAYHVCVCVQEGNIKECEWECEINLRK